MYKHTVILLLGLVKLAQRKKGMRCTPNIHKLQSIGNQTILYGYKNTCATYHEEIKYFHTTVLS